MGSTVRSRRRTRGLGLQIADGGPGLRLADGVGQLSAPPLGVDRRILYPHLRHLLRPGAAMGRLSAAPAPASIHERPAFGHDCRVYRDYPLRPAWRVRPAIPDRTETKC